MVTCGHFSYEDRDRPGLDRYGLGIPAMQYQMFGCRVLPLVRGGKKPHRMLPDSGGVHHASDSPQDAARWWQVDPAANIGVATGWVSGLAVVDLDVKKSDGPGAWTSFLRQYRLELPHCPVVRTPSGGQHAWLCIPPGNRVPDRPGILPGVDVKGDGGLVVAPPSMQLITPLSRPGEPAGDPVPVPYEWMDGHCPCQAPWAPPWFLSWLGNAPGGHNTAASGGPASDDLDLGKLVKIGVPVSQRNATLYRLACQRYRVHGTSGAGPSAVADEIREVWDAGDKTDMSWREILVILESARRFIDKQEANERRLPRWVPNIPM